jgi:DNA invertase Pin-like site-specific DNA recombinase
MTRPYVKERKEQIIELAIKQGLSASTIAERFGCGRQSVSKVLNESGHEWNPAADRWVQKRIGIGTSPP